jgi:hypothetical protein
MNILIIFVAFIASTFAELELSHEECKEIGFNPETLKCSACEKLSQFQLEEILTDCQRCCTKDVTETHERFPLAVFEVCDCNLGRFPQVNAFVKSEMKDDWGNKVKVKQVRGTLPTILLKSADGRTQRTLNIEKWDTDTITDFLNDWLE